MANPHEHFQSVHNAPQPPVGEGQTNEIPLVPKKNAQHGSVSFVRATIELSGSRTFQIVIMDCSEQPGMRSASRAGSRRVQCPSRMIGNGSAICRDKWLLFRPKADLTRSHNKRPVLAGERSSAAEADEPDHASTAEILRKFGPKGFAFWAPGSVAWQLGRSDSDPKPSQRRK